MNIAFSKDFGTIVVSLEKNSDTDVQKCQKLVKLYESEEWLTLVELLVKAEEKYDEVVMKVKPQEQSFRETAIYAARKSGFCEAMNLLKKAVTAYLEYREDRKEEISNQIDQILGQEEINVNE